MSCFMCKGMIKEGFSTFTVDIDGCIIIIKNVPSNVCCQCSEASYSDKVAKRLEEIVHDIMASYSTEVAVVSYSNKAA